MKSLLANSDQTFYFGEFHQWIDPVHLRFDGWYFWHETWADESGPYKTKSEARLGCLLYAKLL